jgi:hypothetical protein
MLPKPGVDQVLAICSTKLIKCTLISTGSLRSCDRCPICLFARFLKPKEAHCSFGRTVPGHMPETRVYLTRIEHGGSGDGSDVNRKWNLFTAAIVLYGAMGYFGQFPPRQLAFRRVVLDPFVADTFVDAECRSATLHRELGQPKPAYGPMLEGAARQLRIYNLSVP